MYFDEFPTSNQIRIAPELATLAILDSTLHVTIQTILAIYPDVSWENDDPDDPVAKDPRSQPSRMAAEILDGACELLEDLFAYRALRTPTHPIKIPREAKTGLPF